MRLPLPAAGFGSRRVEHAASPRLPVRSLRRALLGRPRFAVLEARGLSSEHESGQDDQRRFRRGCKLVKDPRGAGRGLAKLVYRLSPGWASYALWDPRSV